MAEHTKISYCDATANAWWSCSRVHVGCASCYAEQLAGRFGIPWGPSAPRRYMPGWRKVLAKVARRAEREGRNLKVFLNDMSDLFDDHDGDVVDAKKQRLWIRGAQIEAEFGDFTENALRINRFEPLRVSYLRQQVFAEVDRYSDRLTFLMVTKRPGNIRRMWRDVIRCTKCGAYVHSNKQKYCGRGDDKDNAHRWISKRDNVWLLYSASDQSSLEAGLPHLLACRDLVPVLGLSLEPLVGHVVVPAGIDWVIVGAESGPRARSCHLGWIRAVVEQCRQGDIPCFVKQLGYRPVYLDAGGDRSDPDYNCMGWREEKAERVIAHHAGYMHLKDKKGGDMAEWPSDLRVQEFPKGAT